MRNHGRQAAFALVLALLGSSGSSAADLNDPSPQAKAPVGVADRKRRDYDAPGFRFGNWIFNPSVIASITFDDNLFASRVSKKSDVVYHLIPTVTAAGDFGATALSAYASVDGRVSTYDSSLSALSPSVGLGFKTEIQRDLTVQGRADYAYRLEDPSDTNQVLGAGIIRDLVRYHDFTSSLSVNKSFDRFYVSTGLAYQHLEYQNVQDVLRNNVDQSFRDGDIVNWTTRGGYEAIPGVKVFVEPSYNVRRYRSQLFNSDGWRLVGGVSMEFGRLVTGEIFAGYLHQNYDFFRSAKGLAAGANLRWFATELLTVSLRAERGIQDNTTSLSNLIGGPAVVNSASLQGDYELLRNLILTGRVGVQNTTYRLNNTRDANLYSAGLTASYLFNRLMSASLDYKYSLNDANLLNSRYTRNQFTISVKGQF